MSTSLRWAAIVTAAAFLFPICARAQSGNIKVTVIAIVATDKNAEISKELADIAPELQKKEPKLTGFTLERATCKSMKIGDKDSFHLVDKEFVEVKLRVKNDNHVSLTIKPPTMGEVDYTTCCGKFFPMFTSYRTKEKGELLIVAVMVKPCMKNNPPK
jgi:hypothetical protein